MVANMNGVVRIEKLQDCPAPIVESVGGKAFQQLLAKSDGLPVLNGFALSTILCPKPQEIERISRLDTQQKGSVVADYLEGNGVDLKDELSRLGADSYAVRSSAAIEDSERASFAGSFETVLKVTAEQVPIAIFRVWQSALQGRVSDYARDRGVLAAGEVIRVGVLIQPMVRATFAGIAFSHPIGSPGDPRVLVTLTRGLGESLVSGTETGETYWIERLTWRILAYQNAKSLSKAYTLIPEVGRTITKLELLRGCPQDIEYTFNENGDFILLQNRPITSKA